MPEQRQGWARNPYALAEIVLGAAPDWTKLEVARRLAPELARLLRAADYDALLRSATAADPVPTVMHLFDRVPVPPGAYASVHAALATVERLHPRAGAIINAFRADPDGQRALERLVPLLTRVTPTRSPAGAVGGPPAGTPHPAGAPLPTDVDWHATPPGGPVMTAISGAPAVDFRDPVQGVVGDCYLIAAISAVAWVFPQQWSSRVERATDGAGDSPCRFEFHRPLAGDSQFAIVSRELPFTDHGVVPYTRSRDAAESWPTLYEKAYLVWSTPGLAGNPRATDYQSLDQRTFPHAACAQLMRLSFTGDLDSVEFGTGGGRVVRELKKRCTPPRLVAGGAYTSSWSAVPLTGWTFDGDDPEYANAKNEFTVESQLVADHAFAVLGWCADPQGSEWVIVRNPWGRNPTRGGYFGGSDGADPTERLWLTGRPEPELAAVRLGADGVFGVPAALFGKCFKAIAWAEPLPT